MSMIEKVARAIDEASSKFDYQDINDELFKACAIAAIKAMREIDEELIDYGHLYASTSSNTVKEIWEGIFNAALKED